MFKYRNVILSALSAQRSPILSEMQKVDLKQRDVLYDVGSTIDHVYFMESAVSSVLTIMQDGASIEVGIIGFEGVIGVSVLLGEATAQQHIVIQLPRIGYKVKTSLLKEEFERNNDFRHLTLRFVESFIDLTGQTAACNRLHVVEQRCARWLLMSSDRIQSNFLPLTQEYMSAMVGVRRSGVSEAAGELQRAGLISYKKGQVEIIDRKGLEKIACECYALDNERFKRIISKK